MTGGAPAATEALAVAYDLSSVDEALEVVLYATALEPYQEPFSTWRRWSAQAQGGWVEVR
jgi:hypothetical protein